MALKPESLAWLRPAIVRVKEAEAESLAIVCSIFPEIGRSLVEEFKNESVDEMIQSIILDGEAPTPYQENIRQDLLRNLDEVRAEFVKVFEPEILN